MLTKPFVFVVQVVVTIFGTEAREYEFISSDPSHDLKDLHGIEIPVAWAPLSYRRRSHPSLSPGLNACAIIGDVSNLGPSTCYKKKTCLCQTSVGHAAALWAKILTKPFVFIVQVSSYLPAPYYRSENRFLVLLPRPLGSFFSCICAFWYGIC
ncbi:hypothetical protein MRX96_021241 [Rhipicephalus microplus]